MAMILTPISQRVEECLCNGKDLIFMPIFYSGEFDKHSFIGLFLRVKEVFSESAIKFWFYSFEKQKGWFMHNGT